MGLMGIWSDVGRERGGEPESILVVSGRVGEWVDGPLGGHRVGKGGWMGDEIGKGARVRGGRGAREGSSMVSSGYSASRAEAYA